MILKQTQSANFNLVRTIYNVSIIYDITQSYYEIYE